MKTILALIAALLLSPLSALHAADSAAGKPNIIFILVDDLGWGDLGCYGNLDIATPSLDRMAEEGMLFEQFYVNASLCSPSRASILTGRFPAELGIHYWMSPDHNRRMGMPEALDPTLENLPQTLQRVGYRTAHFGKWHVGQDKAIPVTAYGYDETDIVWQGVGPNPGVRMNAPDGTAKLVDRSIAFGEKCSAEGKPFFITLWPRDVHADLAPTEEALARYERFRSRPGIATAMQIYYAAVTEMDAQIGRLLDWVDADPARGKNTLVIFTNDNGPEAAEIPHAGYHAAGSTGPFRGRKRSLYEGGVRVPFIARWKGSIPAGTVDETSVVSGVDLLPTLANLASADLAEGAELDGEDFSATLLKAARHLRTKPLLWEWRFEGVGSLLDRSPMLAIRDGDWKLLFNPDGSRVELYDIPRQPMELHSQAEAHPDVVARLRETALAWQATLPDGPRTENPGSLDYPGYHEAPGRGPLLDRAKYETLLQPVRVRLMRDEKNGKASDAPAPAPAAAAAASDTAPAPAPIDADLFEKPNLAAWCIVPFDAQKRSPEARAEMVAKMGIKKIAYDWRKEHVAEFEREILAYQKHGIEFFAFWGQHEEAFALFKKYQLSPQIWIMMKGTGETQEAQVKSAAEGLLPILAKAEAIGSQVGIYNHGGWGGEPENMVAVCEYLKANHGTENVGIVYNLHHGHSHLDRFPKAIEAMKPHLLCFNLNGMDIEGDKMGRKILPLGVGTEDVKVLRQIRASGYSGPVGILNHTNEDAEGRLLDNLDGLRWILPQLDGNKPGSKPEYRTWSEAEADAPPGQAATAATPALFAKSNLAAWCIVPFDGKKRGPEERAAMLKDIGITKFVYDYRAEHIPQWDEEMTALKKHGIELLGWYFPTVLNDRARETLELFQRHGVKPQLWVSGGGREAVETENEADQQARIAREVERLQPICEAAAEQGLTVGLYNHGGWFGEPENQIAILEVLKTRGITNAGIVYNLHHGHGHLDRLPQLLEAMKSHLLCFNLNGMDIEGDKKGRKILPLGVGTQDSKVLRQIRESGYDGPIGILNHTDEDAEARLLDNLDGLRWILPKLDGNKPGSKPEYRTWSEAEAGAPPGQAATAAPGVRKAVGVPSLSSAFGNALSGGLPLPGNSDYHNLPFTIECRAKLNSKDRFNILVACNPKSTDTHWELYTHARRGTLALYLPGRGGDYDSGVDICDGEWHELLASVDESHVRIWVNGEMVLEKPTGKLPAIVRHAGVESFAIGQLVEGRIGCDGLIDDVRLSRGVMEPKPSDAPRQRLDNTLGLWGFDDLDVATPPRAAAPDPAAFAPDLPPLSKADNEHWQEFVNRERAFDYYGKQALHFMKQKPLPELIPAFPGMDGGQQGHWGNQNDKVTWRDGRWAASDLGSLFCGVFKGGGITVPKGICVRFDDKAAVFDPERMTWRLEWKGGFLKLNENRHGFMSGAPMDGQIISREEKKLAGTYRGLFRRGKEVTIITSETPLPAPAAAQWPQWLKTKGELGTQTPFATDRLTIPFDNPYGTLFFITAHDFFSDGTAAIATMTGEVWLVKGIAENLETLSWKRFATGLHQPLGVKVVNDQLHVLGRDQITRLHDLNGDDEADFYECLTNIMQTSPGGHDFIVGLETDAEGRWLFASGNQGICRVTGNDQLEVLATGFRNPNGLGISPDGRFITTSVQEGDWTPATSICQIEIGRNEGAHFGAGGPKNGGTPEPVLMYLPRGEDNSASSQAFVTGEKWAALQGDGNLVHLSSGGGSAWLVMRQNVKGLWQGAAVRISGNFDSGPQAARFNPNDGHLYVNGMQGWGTYTPKDGAFQRVRFTGGGKPVPIGFEARDNGVLLRFNQPVIEADAETCFAQYWNYKYGPQYGSPEYSVKYADTPGHDPLEVRSVQSLEGGRALFIEIPQIIGANQIHLRVGTGHDVFLTAHALAEPFTDFRGYTKIAKTNHAAQTGLKAPQPAKPNPWAQGEPGREIMIEAALGLQFVQKELTAKAGEKLTIRFKNPDVVPHNWLLAKPSSLEKLGKKCDLMIADPDGLAKHYVPESSDVLAYTDMVNPQSEFVIHLAVPEEPGDYPYLCTFPGHWRVMNGVMKVAR